MGQPVDETSDVAPVDDDERLGEAVEAFLELAERGEAPSAETFAGRYPDIEDDVRAALEGLELVHGLVGGGSSSGGSGPGRNLESGRRIAGYRVVRELGRGGMGTVYDAVHVALDRPVALKVLGTLAAPDSSARRRFLNEARVAAALHHTHIVPVFDVGQVGGLCYYAMQRIEGSGLDRVVRWLRRGRGLGVGMSTTDSGRGSSSRLTRALSRVTQQLPWSKPVVSRRRAATVPPPSGHDAPIDWPEGFDGLDLSRSTLGTTLTSRRLEEDALPPFEPPRGSSYFRWTARVGMHAAEALAHAHQHGVIHRDVKPSNLLIDAEGSIWVADFGLARRLADPGMTHHDGLLGTPRYMSPEQGRTGVIDGRTDVYSLGATLYELLTLRPPFDGSSAAELLDQIAGREPAAPRSIDPRIPRDLETIVLKSLAKRPADRYATAAEQAADLGRFLNREPVKARRISLPGRAWRVLRRHPGISLVSAAASLIVLAVAAIAYHGVARERDLAKLERDQKIAALEQADEALAKTNEAVRETQAARRMELWQRAELVRRLDTPDRRTEGLDLLKKAAALGPDQEMKDRLRDEAAAFLVMREIEPRIELPTGPTRDVVLGAAGSRLVAVTNLVDGEELAFWDVSCQRRSEGITLAARPNSREDFSGGRGGPPPGGGGGPGGGRGGRFMRGGDRLVSCGANLAVLQGGAIQIVDGSTGALGQELKRERGRILSILGEPTGKRLAAVEVEGLDRDGRSSDVEPVYRILLWDLERLEDGPRVLSETPPDARRMWFAPLVALSADGKILAATIDGATTIRLFLTEDGRIDRTIESPADVRALALGGTDMLAAASEGTIQLWNLANPDAGGYVASLSSTQSPVALLQFNPRGTLLATASIDASRVELWDVAAHKVVAVLPSADRVTDLAFSGDGRTLAAGGRSVSTSIWRFQDPVLRTQIGGFVERPQSIALRGDGVAAISDVAGDVWLWRDGEEPYRIHSATAETSSDRGRREEPRGADAPPWVGRRVNGAAFTADGSLVVHDADGLEIYSAGLAPDQKAVHVPAASSPNAGPGRAGMSFWSTWPIQATAPGQPFVLLRGRSVHLWSPDHSDVMVRVAGIDDPFGWPGQGGRRRGVGPGEGAPGGSRDLERVSSGRPTFAQLAPEGDRLYLLMTEGMPSVQAWSLRREDGRVGATLIPWSDAPPEIPTAIALSPDGRRLAISERTGGVVLVDAHRMLVLGRISPRAEEPETLASSLAFAPDGRLAVGSQQGVVRLWEVDDPSSPKPSVRLPGQTGRTQSLTFRPDGRRLAVVGSVGSGSLVEQWDLGALEEELRRLGLGD